MLNTHDWPRTGRASGRLVRHPTRTRRPGWPGVLLASWLLAAPAFAQEAADLLKQAQVKGGLVVHVGCGRGEVTAKLRAGPQYLVHGLDTDAGNVAAARRHILGTGGYGPICIAQWDGARLPYADNLVNLIVAERLGRVPAAEIMRVLAPNGVVLAKGRKLDARSESLPNGWTRTVKPRPPRRSARREPPR